MGGNKTTSLRILRRKSQIKILDVVPKDEHLVFSSKNGYCFKEEEGTVVVQIAILELIEEKLKGNGREKEAVNGASKDQLKYFREDEDIYL